MIRPELGLAIAVLSGRHPGQHPFAGRNPEALVAGQVRGDVTFTWEPPAD
jgi:hypothetical protein